MDAAGYLAVRRLWQPGDVLACALDLAPRLTYPARRIDALRGTAAVERGPLVYCFEQADQPAGVSIEDLALGTGAPRELPGTLPGVGPTVLIEADAGHLPPVAGAGLPYAPRPDVPLPGAPPPAGPLPGAPPPAGASPGGWLPAGRAVTATAIPYFQWDNRDGRAMRVWMPSEWNAPGDSPPRRAQETE